MERPVLAEPGDGLHSCALRLDGEHAARVDCDPVQQDGAGAADALPATVLDLGGARLVAQEVQ